jgi:hypothetical protein
MNWQSIHYGLLSSQPPVISLIWRRVLLLLLPKSHAAAFCPSEGFPARCFKLQYDRTYCKPMWLANSGSSRCGRHPRSFIKFRHGTVIEVGRVHPLVPPARSVQYMCASGIIFLGFFWLRLWLIPAPSCSILASSGVRTNSEEKEKRQSRPGDGVRAGARREHGAHARRVGQRIGSFVFTHASIYRGKPSRERWAGGK